MSISIKFSQQFIEASRPTLADINAHHKFITAIDRQCDFTDVGLTRIMPNLHRIPDQSSVPHPINVEATISNLWIHMMQSHVERQIRGTLRETNIKKSCYEIVDYIPDEDLPQIKAKVGEHELLGNVKFSRFTDISDLAGIQQSAGFQELRESCKALKDIEPRIIVETDNINTPEKRFSAVNIQFCNIRGMKRDVLTKSRTSSAAHFAPADYGPIVLH